MQSSVTTNSPDLDIDLTGNIKYSIPAASPLPGNFLDESLSTRKVSSRAFIVNDSQSKILGRLVEIWTKAFRPGEVEEIDTFRDEIERGSCEGSKAKFICVAVCDPLIDDADCIVSGAYGSVQGEGLAIRLMRTDEEWRGSSISMETDYLLIDIARIEAKERGYDLKFMLAECVEQSESYWNKLGMKRIYFADSGEELKYFIAPTAWNPDGTPATECIDEHLQIAQLQNLESNTISAADLRKTIIEMWDAWYVRPREKFKSDAAHQHHLNIIRRHLETILEQLDGHDTLWLMTKGERESF